MLFHLYVSLYVSMSQLNLVFVFQWKWLNLVANIWLFWKKTNTGYVIAEKEFWKTYFQLFKWILKRKVIHNWLKAGFNLAEFAKLTKYNICQFLSWWIPGCIILFETRNNYHSKTFLYRNQAQARLWFTRLLFKNNKRNDKRFNICRYSLFLLMNIF